MRGAVEAGNAARRAVEEGLRGGGDGEAVVRAAIALHLPRLGAVKPGEASATRLYAAGCTALGVAAGPLTASRVLAVMFWGAARGVQSGGIVPMLSGLRAAVAGLRLQAAGLDAAAWTRLASDAAALRMYFPQVVDRKAPVTDAVLLQLRDVLAPYLQRPGLPGDWARQWWSIVTLGYACCFRFADYQLLSLSCISELALAAGGVGGREPGEPEASYTITMPFTKTQKDTWDKVRDARPVPRRGGPLDASDALRAYLAGRRMVPGGADELLFPRLRKSGAVALKAGAPGPYSHELALGNLRFLLDAARVPDGDSYGMHSLRSGGATHYLALGLPWDVVKRIGNWRADSSLQIYDRRAGDLVRQVWKLHAPYRR